MVLGGPSWINLFFALLMFKIVNFCRDFLHNMFLIKTLKDYSKLQINADSHGLDRMVFFFICVHLRASVVPVFLHFLVAATPPLRSWRLGSVTLCGSIALCSSASSVVRIWAHAVRPYASVLLCSCSDSCDSVVFVSFMINALPWWYFFARG